MQAGGLKQAGQDPRTRYMEVGEVEESGAASKPGANSQPVVAGWQSRPGGDVTLRTDDGELVIDSTGPDPWLMAEVPANVKGPADLEIEFKGSQAGKANAFARGKAKGFQAGTGVAAQVAGNDEWETVTFQLPTKGTLGAVRFDPPGEVGECRIRLARVLDQNGNELFGWKF